MTIQEGVYCLYRRGSGGLSAAPCGHWARAGPAPAGTSARVRGESRALYHDAHSQVLQGMLGRYSRFRKDFPFFHIAKTLHCINVDDSMRRACAQPRPNVASLCARTRWSLSWRTTTTWRVHPSHRSTSPPPPPPPPSLILAMNAVSLSACFLPAAQHRLTRAPGTEAAWGRQGAVAERREPRRRGTAGRRAAPLACITRTGAAAAPASILTGLRPSLPGRRIKVAIIFVFNAGQYLGIVDLKLICSDLGYGLIS